MQASTDHPQPVGADAALDAPAVRVYGLTHRYPHKPSRRKRNEQQHSVGRPALDGVSFDIRPGEVFGILGPNGGGKTTLFKILSTILRPTEGRASVFGHDVVGDSDAVRQNLGVVFQYPSLDGKLTARENLVHAGHLYGLSGAHLSRRIDALLAEFALSDRAHDHTERFSGGMRRRVELAKALLHEPRLLLLDEPSTGLDPGARIDLWRQLATLRSRGVTVALTTHLMDEADRCDRLAILSRGRLIALDSPAALKARIGGDVVTVEPRADAPDNSPEQLAAAIAERFGPWSEGAAPSVIDGRVHFERAGGAAFIATLTDALPHRVRSVTVGQPTLESVFMHLTGHGLWRGEGDE